MINRPNEEMTQEMVDDFYHKAKGDWEELLDEYGMTAVGLIYSQYQDIAVARLAAYEEVKEEAESLGFTLPSLVEGVVIEFDDYMQEQELAPTRVLH